jgi:protoheme IX farnesyltransferase
MIMGTASKYLELTKPKVTLLNLFVAMTSFVLAEYPSVNWTMFSLFSVVGYLAVGGSCALNCYLDRDLDAIMDRTSKRAIPSGAVLPRMAAFFGLLLLASGLALSWVFFGPLAATIIFTGSFVYVVVYTRWLKRYASWGVVIGGISGSMAAFYGWAATGSLFTITPLLIAALDFLWTPGHLWGLAIRNADDYRKAGVPALPVIAGAKKSSYCILAFNVSTIGLSMLFPALGGAGLVYFSLASISGIVLLWESWRLVDLPSPSQAFRVFLSSMPYLAVILVSLLLDKLLFVGL